MTNINKLFLETEPSIRQTLVSLSTIVSKFKFIKDLSRIYQYNDEPKIFQFAASLDYTEKETDGDLNTTKRAGGSSFISKEHAFLKCLCEALERYACSIYKIDNVKFCPYKDIRDRALNPDLVTSFSLKQKKDPHYRDFIFNENSQFGWVKGKSIDGNNIYIPAQLVYFTYIFHIDEGRIYIPISTGAAGGGTMSAALVRAILEVVERDSFMIFYLNKLPGKKLNLESIKNSVVKKILTILKQYKLELHLIDITTDLNIPTYASLVVDRTGIGPAIQVGLKSSLNPIHAIIESIHEALHIRNWIRQIYEDEYLNYKNRSSSNIKTVEDRGIYWYRTRMLKHLSFWLNQPTKDFQYNQSEQKIEKSGKSLKIILDIFKKHKYDIFYVDITPSLITKDVYKIVKVIIPGLQPLFLHEGYKYLGGDRLNSVPVKLGYKTKVGANLNTIPHPFL